MTWSVRCPTKDHFTDLLDLGRADFTLFDITRMEFCGTGFGHTNSSELGKEASGSRCFAGRRQPATFFTKQAFRPMAMPSILQDIS